MMSSRAIDLKAALAGLPALPAHARPPSETVRYVMTQLGDCAQGGLFLSRFDGNTPWERHRGDEIVHCLDGAARLTILTGADERVLALSAGVLAIVPDGCWHKFDTMGIVTVLSITPQPTDHSSADDPRA